MVKTGSPEDVIEPCMVTVPTPPAEVVILAVLGEVPEGEAVVMAPVEAMVLVATAEPLPLAEPPAAPPLTHAQRAEAEAKTFEADAPQALEMVPEIELITAPAFEH